MSDEFVTLAHNSNQARGLGQFAIDFLSGRFAGPDESVLRMVERFHCDSMACGVSALACGANAPTVLRHEALEYECRPPARGVPCFGSRVLVCPKRRSWPTARPSASGTPMERTSATTRRAVIHKGEFGHNDYYPVAVAAAQLAGFDGRKTLWAMILLDEIRGRLAEVYSLKDHKIDHVLYGAIASAAVFAAVLGATAEQIESAIGLVVAHYVPFRAIRAGKQLSDSKGASAAISSEVAVLSASGPCAASSDPPISSAIPRPFFVSSRGRIAKARVPSI